MSLIIYTTKIYFLLTIRSAETKYSLENGEELVVNEGNTFIQIQPKGLSLDIIR